MAVFIIAISFAHKDDHADYSATIDSVNIPEEWLLHLKYMKTLNQAEMIPLISQELWGDGTGIIPHFSKQDIITIKENCNYILDLKITEQTILKEGLPDYYNEIFKEFKLSLEKLIRLCNRAIDEKLVMVFISN